MAKSKVRKKNIGFVIEGIMNYEGKTIEVEEIGEYPFDKIFEQFDGRNVKITIDIPDTEIDCVPIE